MPMETSVQCLMHLRRWHLADRSHGNRVVSMNCTILLYPGWPCAAARDIEAPAEYPTNNVDFGTERHAIAYTPEPMYVARTM